MNPQPTDYKSVALPIELSRHNEDIKLHHSHYNAFNTIRVFETPLLNDLLGLCLLITPSGFWLRHSQHSQADTDFNATDLELSYWFSIDLISI